MFLVLEGVACCLLAYPRHVSTLLLLAYEFETNITKTNKLEDQCQQECFYQESPRPFFEVAVVVAVVLWEQRNPKDVGNRYQNKSAKRESRWALTGGGEPKECC